MNGARKVWRQLRRDDDVAKLAEVPHANRNSTTTVATRFSPNRRPPLPTLPPAVADLLDGEHVGDLRVGRGRAWGSG